MVVRGGCGKGHGVKCRVRPGESSMLFVLEQLKNRKSNFASDVIEGGREGSHLLFLLLGCLSLMVRCKSRVTGHEAVLWLKLGGLSPIGLRLGDSLVTLEGYLEVS